jgi:poly-gamma-glutamate synthesis protein (capsule biosynthesis protein)
MSKIIIGADFVPTITNEHLFMSSDANTLLGKNLIDRIAKADYRIFNLEVPLTQKVTPIPKNGPNLYANPEAVMLYDEINVNLFTLANNHIMDQGVEGLYSTIETLQKKKINYVGVGDNLSSAATSFIFRLNNKKIGIYACTEHEFSIAKEKEPGANPFDPLESLDHISELKKEVDYIIVLYHGGKEHYRYPSPLLQKACRKMVDHGANLIVCQHSHCVGCKEDYNSSTIVYGQGNFIFDLSNSEYWKESLLLELDLDNYQIDYIPIVKKNNLVRLAGEIGSKRIIDDFYYRSESIKENCFIDKKYSEYAKQINEMYYYSLLGKISKSFLFRIIRRLFPKRITNFIWSRKEKLKLINIIECEAHRELFLASIKDSIREK